MRRDRFINDNMSVALDAVRGVAALVVLLGHSREIGIYTGPFPLSSGAQHHAVIFFFVLSGLVISHSVAVRDYSLREYAIARAARIVPLAWVAVLFGLASAWMLGERDQTISEIVLPMLFLGEGWGRTEPPLNPPYWSLTYEVWFYALFAATAFLRGPWRLFWLTLLAGIAGWRIILMFPIWLAGAWLARLPGGKCTPAKALAACLAAMVCFLAAQKFGTEWRDTIYDWHVSRGYDLAFSEYFLADYVLACGVGTLFVAMRPIADIMSASLMKAAPIVRGFAGFSFTLYILHWPMLQLMKGHGIVAGNSIPVYVLLMTGVIAACAVIARYTEDRAPMLRRVLTRRIGGTDSSRARAT